MNTLEVETTLQFQETNSATSNKEEDPDVSSSVLRNTSYYISILSKICFSSIDVTLFIVFTSFSIGSLLPLEHSVLWLESKIHLHYDALGIWYKINGGS